MVRVAFSVCIDGISMFNFYLLLGYNVLTIFAGSEPVSDACYSGYCGHPSLPIFACYCIVQGSGELSLA